MRPRILLPVHLAFDIHRRSQPSTREGDYIQNTERHHLFEGLAPILHRHQYIVSGRRSVELGRRIALGIGGMGGYRRACGIPSDWVRALRRLRHRHYKRRLRSTVYFYSCRAVYFFVSVKSAVLAAYRSTESVPRQRERWWIQYSERSAVVVKTLATP